MNECLILLFFFFVYSQLRVRVRGKKDQTSKEKTDLCQSCEYLPSELCDGPISLITTEEDAAEYETAAVALRRKFGANPSTNGNLACGASDGAKCPV